MSREPSNLPSASGQPAVSQISGERVAQSIRSRFNTLRNLTPETLTAQLGRWDLGYLCELALLMEAVKVRDWRIRAVTDKREKALARLHWEIVAIDGADEALAKKHAATLKGLYNSLRTTHALDQNARGSLRLLVRQMADAIGKKFAVHELLWRPQPGHPSAPLSLELKFCPLWWFENTTGRLRYLKSDYELAGVDLEPNGWMTTSGDGLMIPTVIAWLFRRLPLQDWLGYCEKFGLPFIDAATDAAPDSPEWTALSEAVAGFIGDGAIVRSRNAEINLIEARGAGALPHPALLEYFDREIATLWRGGNLSTSSAADSVGANLQQEEKDVLIEDDAPWIEETLHEQISKFAIQYVHGDAEPAAYLKFSLPKKDTTAAALKRFTFAAENGLELGKAAVRDALCLPTPADGEEILGKVGPQSSASPYKYPAAGGNNGDAVESVHTTVESPLP